MNDDNCGIVEGDFRIIIAIADGSNRDKVNSRLRDIKNVVENNRMFPSSNKFDFTDADCMND